MGRSDNGCSSEASPPRTALSRAFEACQASFESEKVGCAVITSPASSWPIRSTNAFIGTTEPFSSASSRKLFFNRARLFETSVSETWPTSFSTRPSRTAAEHALSRSFKASKSSGLCPTPRKTCHAASRTASRSATLLEMTALSFSIRSVNIDLCPGELVISVIPVHSVSTASIWQCVMK